MFPLLCSPPFFTEKGPPASSACLFRVFLKLGEFHENSIVAEDEEGLLKSRKTALSCYQSATETGPQLRRAWQSWALANYAMIDYYRQQLQALRVRTAGKGAEYIDLGTTVTTGPSSSSPPDAWQNSNFSEASAGITAEQERTRAELTALIETHCVPAVRGLVSSVMYTEKGSLQVRSRSF